MTTTTTIKPFNCIPVTRFLATPFGVFAQKVKFPNGYYASIVHHGGSYGCDRGEFEVAICSVATDKIVYDTPITSDVEGFLDFRGVADILDQIAALPVRCNG